MINIEDDRLLRSATPLYRTLLDPSATTGWTSSPNTRGWHRHFWVAPMILRRAVCHFVGLFRKIIGATRFLKHEGPWWGGGHSPFFIPEKMNYELFADANSNEPVLEQPDREKGPGYSRENPAKWTKSIPVRVRAMVLAGNRLFAVGPPNVVPADDPFAAFEGRMGSRFCVFSIADGEKLWETSLECVPVFDGLIAAGNHLYMATTDGNIVCFGE